MKEWSHDRTVTVTNVDDEVTYQRISVSVFFIGRVLQIDDILYNFNVMFMYRRSKVMMIYYCHDPNPQV